MQIELDNHILPIHKPLMHDILDHKHTHYTLYGGRGGAKSSFIGIAIPLLITQYKDCHAVVLRKVANTLRDSVYAQICFGISILGLTSYFSFKVSPMEITFKATGQKILFRGADEPEKIKSLKAPFGYFGITWFEELDQFRGREETRNILQSTMRGGDKFWNFESFNPPISNLNWVNKDLLIDRPDRLTIKSCYLDAPIEWLGEQFMHEAQMLKDINEKAYRHEYLGEAVGTGGTVFENLKTETITDKEIAEYDYLYHGLDFGWYPDPNAFVKCYYDKKKRELYIFDEFKSYKMNSMQLENELSKHINKSDLLICDNSDHKTIADLKEFGYNAFAASKGAGSVDRGIKWLQGLTAIIIDPKRCPNTAKEFAEYEYERTKSTNEIISAYPDKNNHFIDAVRYSLNKVINIRGE